MKTQVEKEQERIDGLNSAIEERQLVEEEEFLRKKEELENADLADSERLVVLRGVASISFTKARKNGRRKGEVRYQN